MSRRSLVLALTLSVAFNLGFLGMLAFHHSRGQAEAVRNPFGSMDDMQRLAAMDDQLRDGIVTIRLRQAALTRRLSDLIAEPQPDQTEIDRCLDRLSAAGREVQGVVVQAILTQKSMLPTGEQPTFCRYIHRRLCEPWGKCGYPEGCGSPDSTDSLPAGGGRNPR